jgi:hypothetical protein
MDITPTPRNKEALTQNCRAFTADLAAAIQHDEIYTHQDVMIPALSRAFQTCAAFETVRQPIAYLPMINVRY